MPKLTAQERRHYKARLTAALVASAAVPAEMAPELAAHLLSWDAARIEFDRLIDPTMKARLSNADRAALAGAYMSIGVLRPIKSGGSVQVGGISVPKRYAVGFTTLDPDDPAAERARRREIKALDMRICVRNPDYLLRHPLDYEAYRFGLTHLSDWLRDSRPDAVEVTRKERSYEIWGSEDALDAAASALAAAEADVRSLAGAVEKVTALAALNTALAELVEARKEAEKTAAAAEKAYDAAEEKLIAARDAVDEARRNLGNVKGELAGVAKPESGNLVQGSFDRLLAEYFELMQQIGAEVGALQKALNEAETEYAEAKESARGKRAEAEKRLRAYCEPFADIDAEARVAESLAEDAPVPTRKQVDALAEARTAANDAFKAADLAKARAQIEKDDAGKKLDGALAALRERCGEKAAIVREPESLVGDFTKKISEANGRHRALEKEISALASLEEGCGKAAECARRRGSAAIAHPELTRPIVDLEAYRREIGRSGDELARAKAAREKSRAGYADAVKAFADTSEASDAMLAETPKAAAAMREHADGVADFIAGRTTLDMAGKTLEKAAGVLNASAAGVKGNLDFNDESLDTAISNLLDVANESIGYLRGLEKSSGGDLEIPCCHRRPPRAEYDARFRDGVRETLVRMSASVGKRDGGLASCRDEISRELEQDVVSIKSLIARHIDIVQGRGVPFSMKFTSPRLGEAKKLTWNELRGLSGGEKAQVFFLICSLLAQTAVEGDPATHRAFLLMDNPFANLSNEERLDYCMDVATANNVQIVATKQLGAAIPILDSFDYRYMLHGYRATSAPVVTIESERTTVPDSSLSVMVARSISLRGHAGTARLPLDV